MPSGFSKLSKPAPKQNRKFRLFGQTYRHDRVAFAHDCIRWEEGEEPTGYQDEILAELEGRKRVSPRGPHGLGKTTLAAIAALHHSLTREALELDWKVATTAGVWRQLSKFLWPEIHKWTHRLRWDRIGRDPFDEPNELQRLSLKLHFGEAFAASSTRPELIEGAHADSLLYIFDESKAIPAVTFDAAEGAFSAAGAGKCEAFALALSTPGEPAGRFYEIQSRKPGYDDWWPRHVTKDEAIAAGRVSRDWTEKRAAQWGEKSTVYQNRVEGNFASSAEDSVIPLSWVEAANERWHEWQEAEDKGAFIGVGVDVGRFGDKTVLAPLRGDAIEELRRYAKADTMETAGHVVGVLGANGGRAVVDVIGIGAGVVDRGREQGFNVIPFNASARTDATDKTGELGFVNLRAAGWWNLREMLDPSRRPILALPPDDLLTGDLTAPKWRVMSGGKIQVEAKEDIKKRIGRSTDDGDAVMMACCPVAWFCEPEPDPLWFS